MIMIDNVQLESLAQILSKGQASGEMSQNSGLVLYMKNGAGSWEPAPGLDVEGAAQGAAQARLLELVTLFFGGGWGREIRALPILMPRLAASNVSRSFFLGGGCDEGRWS